MSEIHWIVIGFAAHGLLALRFIVQWLASEKAGKVVIPVTFWYISLAAVTGIFAYAVYRQDIVFIVGQFLAAMIFIRNLMIHYKRKEK